LWRCTTHLLSLWPAAHSPAHAPAALNQAPPPGTPPAPESPGLKDGQGTAVVTGIVSLILGVRPSSCLSATLRAQPQPSTRLLTRLLPLSSGTWR
jgi:hypothetical protein